MLEGHEIKVLLKAGHSQREVAELAGVSVPRSGGPPGEADIEHVDDAAERFERGIGRPSLVQSFRKPVTELVEKEQALLSVEVLRRTRVTGYTGQKSALYALDRLGPTEGREAPGALRGASTTSGRWKSSTWTGPRSGSASSLRD